MNLKKNDLLYYLGLASAVWFAWMGMVWMYAAAVFIAYPAGLLSFFIWRHLKKENRTRTKWIPRILTVGLVLSLSMLLFLLIWD